MNAIYPGGLPVAMSLVGYNSILTGLFILFKRRDHVGFHYFLFALAVFLWGAGVSFMLNNEMSSQSAEWWGYFSQRAALFIPVTWFHFVLIYTNKMNVRKKILYAFYFITLVVFIFSFTPNYILGFRKIVGVNHYPIPGSFYIAFTILFIVIVTLTFTILFDAFMKEKSKERKMDYKRLFIANLYGFSTGSLSFLPVYGIPLPQYNLLIMPLWQFLLAYAMVRYQLINFEEIVEAGQREKLAVIGTLAASINHEIRNPLYAVKGLLEIQIENAKEGLPTKEPLQTSEKALSQINRALDVITKLNRFAKPAPELTGQPASIQEAIQNVLGLVSYEFSLDKIKINNQIPNNLPQIRTDQRQLEEIFFNLIVNACHAMEGGGELTISASYHSERSGPLSFPHAFSGNPDPRLKHSWMTSKVRITIQDTGTGISSEQAKHLFEPFHTTKGDKGTGLGLYITKQLVERNGGKISVSSKPNQGTSFILEFKTHESL